jgi:hypothetical protein
MLMRRLLFVGVPTSLQDLGYSDVGLDDAWQDQMGFGGSIRGQI